MRIFIKSILYAVLAAFAIGTRFVLDDDWVLNSLYPFPMDVCLQMQRKLNIMTYFSEAEYAYYECNGNGNVDKYKWSINEVPTIGNEFDCGDKASAVKTEFVFDANLANCDVGYFQCDGNDNLATVAISTQMVIGADLSLWDCSNADQNVLTTSLATDVCFCDTETGLSRKITCDQTELLEYNYTDSESQCGGVGASRRIGAVSECAYLMPLTLTASGVPLTLPLSTILQTCVQAGEVVTPTARPTANPTIGPTAVTIGPTAVTFGPTAVTVGPTAVTFGPTANPTTPTLGPTEVTSAQTVNPITTSEPIIPSHHALVTIQVNVMCTILVLLALYRPY